MSKEKTYSEAEAAARLKEHGLEGWYFEDGWIRRKLVTDGWTTTLLVVQAIGFLAEAADHHPDLNVSWAKLTVKLCTHSAGGITDKDFALARKIEEVILWKPEGGPLRGKQGKWVRGG